MKRTFCRTRSGILSIHTGKIGLGRDLFKLCLCGTYSVRSHTCAAWHVLQHRWALPDALVVVYMFWLIPADWLGTVEIILARVASVCVGQKTLASTAAG